MEIFVGCAFTAFADALAATGVTLGFAVAGAPVVDGFTVEPARDFATGFALAVAGALLADCALTEDLFALAVAGTFATGTLLTVVAAEGFMGAGALLVAGASLLAGAEGELAAGFAVCFGLDENTFLILSIKELCADAVPTSIKVKSS